MVDPDEDPGPATEVEPDDGDDELIEIELPLEPGDSAGQPT